MAKPLEVSDSDFEQVVIKAANPVLVDFWAPWCGPCQAVAPIVEELANEYDGKITFAKINIDENPKTASGYSIMSIPTLLLFKDGKPMKQMVGLRPKEEFKKNLDASLTKIEKSGRTYSHSDPNRYSAPKEAEHERR